METGAVQDTEQQKVQTKMNLFKNHQFIFLWIASTFSGLSLSIYLISEAWYVVNVLELNAWLGIVMMVTTIPRVLFMAVGGAAADRFRRSTILFCSEFIRGLLLAGMVLLLMNGALNIWTLIGFAFCFGVLDAFFWPASRSFLPMIVNKKQITRANSLMQTTNQLSLIIGPAAAGFIIKYGSFEGVFSITAAMLIAGSVLLLFMKEKNLREDSEQDSIINDLKEGIRYVRGFPYLLTVMCSSVVINFFLVGPVNIGLPVLVEEYLNGDVLDLSYLESSLAIGMVIGGIITAVVNFKRKRPIISLILISLLGILCALLSQMTVLWYGMVILLISGIFLSISNIITPSLVQEITDPDKMGRVQSLLSTASMGFTPLSFAAVAALLSAGVPIQPIILTSSSVLTLFSLVVLWKVKMIRTID